MGDVTAARRSDLLRKQAAEQIDLLARLVRLVVLGAVSGGLAGVAGWVFLEGLDRVTRTRTDHGWLLYLLPVAGLVLGLLYHHLGGRARQGNSLLIDQIHEPTDWVPRRMAPLILLGTWTTHLFGGSAGREGTALQLSGGLTDSFSRLIRLPAPDRRVLLIAALGGGFGAVFGVPLAGTVFALEVQSLGRVRYEAIVPSLTAAIVGNEVVRALGFHHRVWAPLDVHLTAWLGSRLALAGLCFGLAGAAFIELTAVIRAIVGRAVAYPPIRTAVGGLAIVGLASLVGRGYLGLSTPVIERALTGDPLSFAVFALKIVFTAITLACAFPGGEVTPLFCIGATLGVALAAPLHVPAVLLAGVGYVAVFAGASNTPLACTVMGAELFGAGAVIPCAIGCVVAYVASGHRSIYSTQRLAVTKAGERVGDPQPIRDWWSDRA
jgi:H+/Cl- antiporter ClcA